MTPMYQIEHPVWKASPKIESHLSKRLEVEHIDEVIEQMTTLPDFGYDTEQYTSKNVGWNMFWELLTAKGKYERVENYIQMKQLHKQQKEDEEKA